MLKICMAWYKKVESLIYFNSYFVNITETVIIHIVLNFMSLYSDFVQKSSFDKCLNF